LRIGHHAAVIYAQQFAASSIACVKQYLTNCQVRANFYKRYKVVSTTSLVFMVFSLLVSVLLPIGLAIFLYRKSRFSIRALLVGVIIFLVSQVFLRIPALQILSQTDWYRAMAQNLWVIALFLSLTAGIFEEIGRWIGFRFMVKKQWQTENGIAYGIGHGGIEAIVLSGLGMVNNIAISIMINTGTFGQVSNQVGPAAAESIRQTLIDTPAYLFGVSGLERAMTMVVHIGLSLVVLESVRRRRPLYLLYAILLHGLVNFPAVMLTQMPNPYLYSELWLLLCAVVSFIYIQKMWRSRETLEIPETPELVIPA
jgi:uncharacterized membrane protein YhfC